MSRKRILVLGGGPGWHADRLNAAAERLGWDTTWTSYESLRAKADPSGSDVWAGNQRLTDFDAVLTRTMPAGGLEAITVRLSMLHRAAAGGLPIVNPPAALEWAIDKYSSVQMASSLGIEVPPTMVSQDRRQAMRDYELLGGDVVIKPLFGGEGRGVMRVQHPELARTIFGTLETSGLVIYQQRFEPPGGRDLRIFIAGDRVACVARRNDDDFRTNRIAGGTASATEPPKELIEQSRRVMELLKLKIAAVDWIETNTGPKWLEINAIPGWKAAQAVIDFDLAEAVLRAVMS